MWDQGMFPQFLGVDMHPVFSLYAKTFLASIEIKPASRGRMEEREQKCTPLLTWDG